MIHVAMASLDEAPEAQIGATGGPPIHPCIGAPKRDQGLASHTTRRVELGCSFSIAMLFQE